MLGFFAGHVGPSSNFGLQSGYSMHAFANFGSAFGMFLSFLSMDNNRSSSLKDDIEGYMCSGGHPGVGRRPPNNFRLARM